MARWWPQQIPPLNFLGSCMFQASSPKRIKLSGDDRTKQLEALTTAGWKEVDGRDAIRKVFMFKNFNQVRAGVLFSSYGVGCVHDLEGGIQVILVYVPPLNLKVDPYKCQVFMKK